MSLNEFTLGQVVQSTQGRDAGRDFVVVGIIDQSYVLIADGALRRIDRPKKKKVKHLIPKQELISSLKEKLTCGQRVYDSELRKALAALRDQGL